MLSSTQLPRAPHPIASAFFDAHDVEIDAPSSNNVADNNSKVAAMKHSLGWRTRHASSRLYPVSVRPVANRRLFGEDENEVASFRVRQVFPRQSHRGENGESEAGNDGEKIPQQVDADDCEYGTGATVWPAAIVLLKYLEQMAHDPTRENVLAGKSVLELGSGTATTSIAAALLGATSVTCTDGCDPVVELAEKNIRGAIAKLGAGEVSSPTSVNEGGGNIPNEATMNLRGCQMSARTYRWGEGVPTSIHDNERSGGFDIILGADCIVPKLYPLEPLVDALYELSNHKTSCYLSFEQRHFAEYQPADEFRRLATARNLVVDVVPDGEIHPMYSANDIEIWRVTRGENGSSDERPGRGAEATATNQRSGGRSNHQSLLVGAHS